MTHGTVRALLGWPEAWREIAIVGPTRRHCVPFAGEHRLAWDLVLVHVAGEHEPRWISADRIRPRSAVAEATE